MTYNAPPPPPPSRARRRVVSARRYAASDDAELKIQVVCALVNADRGDASETAAISKEEISDYLVKIKRTAESLANNTVDLLDCRTLGAFASYSSL